MPTVESSARSISQKFGSSGNSRYAPKHDKAVRRAAHPILFNSGKRRMIKKIRQTAMMASMAARVPDQTVRPAAMA